MRLNCRQEVVCAAIVQEEDSLADAPEGRTAKFLRACPALGNAIREACSHVMDQQVGEEIHRLIAQGGDRGIAGVERGRMAERAPGIAEQVSASCD